MRPVVIIGGGISGLSAAYYLAKAGIPAQLIEKAPRLGGVIETRHIEGCTLETGPDSFISIKPAALELIRELGMADEVIGSNDHLRVTYVWRKGRLVPLPDGLMLMVPTKITPLLASGLLSWATKVRMGLEWFRRPPDSPLPDRSVADFIRDHYGQETVDYLAEPLLSGIYGGDPRSLSVTSVLPRFAELEARYGSLTRGVLAARKRMPLGQASEPIFRTLRRGLGSLVDELARAIRGVVEIRQQAAHSVVKTLEGYRVELDNGALLTDHVVLACPAYAAAGLLRGLDGHLAGLLDSVPYSSSVTIALGYCKTGFGPALNGFGFLVPRKERRRLVACTWVATKFSYRVPEDKVVLRCFLGGTDESVLAESDEILTRAVREELAHIMGVSAEPIFVQISRWPRSMAQYSVGHEERWRQIREHLARLPGVHVAGNAYTGIGVPDCIRMGREAAERIAAAEQGAGSP